MTRNTNQPDTPDLDEYRYAADTGDIQPKRIGHGIETSNVGYRAHTVLALQIGILLGGVAHTATITPAITAFCIAAVALPLTAYYVGTRSVTHTALIALTVTAITAITATATITIATAL